MEFPSLGAHCQYEQCNQIDFLPLQCKCGMVFCREHLNEHCSGECELAPRPRTPNFTNEDIIYKCSEKDCRKGNLHEMLCNKCQKHYCIEHRFHPSCPEIDEETKALKIEQCEATRRQFEEANKNLQEQITKKIRQALQSSNKVKTASKVHLMRIKQKAIGPESEAVSNRVYFAIQKPLNMEAKGVKIIRDLKNMDYTKSFTLDPDLKDTIPLFISKKWSLGRAIDSLCETCNIRNDNNKVGCLKLKLFRQLDGYCISPMKMDVEITELLEEKVLLEGDTLTIEYIDNSVFSNVDEGAQFFLR